MNRMSARRKKNKVNDGLKGGDRKELIKRFDVEGWGADGHDRGDAAVEARC